MSEQGFPVDYPTWLAANPPPDLQELVQQWGGFWNIPTEAWNAYRDEMARWQQARRDRLSW